MIVALAHLHGHDHSPLFALLVMGGLVGLATLPGFVMYWRART